MYTFKKKILLIIGALVTIGFANAQTPQIVALSSVNGSLSKPRTIVSPLPGLKASNLNLTGADRESFKIISFANNKVVIAFNPTSDFVGIKRSRLNIINRSGKVVKTYILNGLATNGLEGEHEPPLSSVVEALGYKMNIGWQTLAKNELPDLQGDEIEAQLFKKMNNGRVEIQPVARYSPDFELAFGYYQIISHAPAENQVGSLAKSGQYVQHQTLMPELSEGTNSFDPGNQEFGFFAKSPTHTAYSEDIWNKVYYPDMATHATRIYAARNANGQLIPNNYLVCFEEAANGDYNDYVFLIKNVIPVTQNKFVSLFNGKDLTGFHTYLQNIGTTDPEHLFRVEDGAVHVIGKLQGYAITDKSYSNYDLKVDFKWGVTKWPPRVNNKRDGGVLYNIPMAEPDSIWPKSIEFQIQEGDVGDFWMLGFSTLRINGKINRPTNHIGVPKKKDNEKPYGEWNTIEIVSYEGKCVQIVNGVVVNYGDQCSVKDGGRICLQSEYSEIYYKNVRIREL